MYKVISHIMFWFLAAAGFYYFFLTSMAESLGIPGRQWTNSDYIEGFAISLTAAVVLSLISLSIGSMIARMRK